MINENFITAIQDVELVKAISLLSEGANPNSKNEYDDPALQIALNGYRQYLHFNNHPEEELENKYIELINMLIDKGAKSKSKKTCELLLKSGMAINDIKSIFKKAKTSLPKKGVLELIINSDSFYRAPEYQIELIEFIESKGIELSSEFLGLAMCNSFPDFDYGIGLHGNRHIIQKNVLPLFEYFLNRGADINTQSNRGHTVLMRAAMNLCPEVCEFLIEHKANVNTQNGKGYTALMFVSGRIYRMCSWDNHEEQYEIAKVLIKNNADINLKANNNRTALSYAKSSNNIKVIELLEK